MKSAMLKLDKVFFSFGIPLKVKSGNGSPFDCGDFDKYAKYLGFFHHIITPVYPQANGLVENFNRRIGKILRTANVEHKSWEQDLYKFLRNYRATSHTTTEKSPAEIMFPNRSFKTRIPGFIDSKGEVKDEDMHKKDAQEKEKINYFADKRNNAKPCNISIGDKENKTLPYYDPNPNIVYSKKGNMIVARRDGHVVTRNSSFFKKNSKNMLNDSYSDYEEQKSDINEPESNIILRCLTRIRNMPKR